MFDGECEHLNLSGLAIKPEAYNCVTKWEPLLGKTKLK